LHVGLYIEALFKYNKDGRIDQIKGMRKMAESCLAKYGFSYTATLKKIATDGLYNTKDVKIVELLLYPAFFANKDGVPLEQVYSPSEVNDIRTICNYLNQRK